MSKGTLSRRHLRRVLKMLTPREKPETARSRKKSTEDIYSTAAPWLSQPGIQGIGIARRRTNGKLLPRMALKVYVVKKLPPLKCQHVVPAKFRISAVGMEVETDVEEVGELRLHGNTGSARPLVPGFGISPEVGGAGTIGCFVRRTDDPNYIYLFGAGHTFLFGRSGRIGDPLFQPAREDDPSGPPQRVATVEFVVDLDFASDGFPNLCDVAIARLDPNVQWSPKIPGIGIPSTVFTNLRTGMRVQINGRTSGLMEGEILDIDFHTAFPIRMANGTERRAGFRTQVLCTHYGAPGDSGAAVVTTSGMLVGVHLGGSDSRSVFSRALPALRAVGVDLIPAP